MCEYRIVHFISNIKSNQVKERGLFVVGFSVIFHLSKVSKYGGLWQVSASPLHAHPQSVQTVTLSCPPCKPKASLVTGCAKQQKRKSNVCVYERRWEWEAAARHVEKNGGRGPHCCHPVHLLSLSRLFVGFPSLEQLLRIDLRRSNVNPTANKAAPIRPNW